MDDEKIFRLQQGGEIKPLWGKIVQSEKENILLISAF